MNKEEIEKVIKKYRKLAGSTFDNEKTHHYEHFADYIEENIENFEEDDYYDSEEDLLDAYHEVESEINAQWDTMFPENDDDD